MTSVITFKLANLVFVETILVLGTSDPTKHISEFHLFVGKDPDYQNNAPCLGGPFAYPITADYETSLSVVNHNSNWINGAEAKCNLEGTYVSFVREATAQPPLDDIILCNFGVIAKECSSGVVIPSSISDRTFFLTHNKAEVVNFDTFIYSLGTACGDFKYEL